MSSIKDIISEEAKNFVKVAKKFFQPIIKWPLLPFVWGATIVVISLYVTTGVGELARHNSDEALFLYANAFTLGAEKTSGLSPNFTQESRNIAEALQAYAEQINKRNLAAILSLLHPDYEKQKKRLMSLSATLKNAPDDKEQAREAIWRAGEQFNEFYRDSEKLSAPKIIWFKSERLPEELVKDLDKSLADSNELANKLEKEPTAENALAACQANRKTMLLLFLARMGYGSQEKIKEFLNIAEKTLYYKNMLAEKIEDPKVKATILIWCDSEQRRVNILKAMLNNDMEKVRNLLKEAIEKTFEEDKAAKSAEEGN